MTKKLFFLLAAILSGCAFFIRPKVTFIIENESGKNLEILFYGNSELLEEVSISSGGKYETTEVVSLGSIGSVTPFDYENTDSLVILFNKERVLLHYCGGENLFRSVNVYTDCFWDKNPFDFDLGKVKKKKFVDKYTKTIVYDNSDYERAVEVEKIHLNF